MIGHNFASNKSIFKIQKRADRRKSEFFECINDFKHFCLSMVRFTFNRGTPKDLIAILKKFMKEHMF